MRKVCHLFIDSDCEYLLLSRTSIESDTIVVSPHSLYLCMGVLFFFSSLALKNEKSVIIY